MGKQKILDRTSFLVALLAVVAFFVMLNYLAFRHWRRWDWSSLQRFSISPATVKALKKVDKELNVYVFLTPENADLYDHVKNLLSSMQGVCPALKVEYVDPDRRLDRARELAKKYHVSRMNAVVFAYGDRSKVVSPDQMADYDASGGFMAPPKIKSYKAEQAFLEAVTNVLDARRPQVVFAVGHGEAGVDSTGDGAATRLKDILLKENFKVMDFATLGKDTLPEDTDVLVILGPDRPWRPEEVTLVRTYLEKGGRLLLALDPVLSEDGSSFTPTGLEPLLKDWGLDAGEDVVIDPKALVPALGAQTFLAADWLPHDITDDLSKNRYAVVFSLARSLAVGDPKNTAYKVRTLLQTTPEAWGEKQPGGGPVEKNEGEIQGPIVVAAAVASDQEEAKARLVVLGDSDALRDGLVDQAANILLVRNAFNWLAERNYRISVPPKNPVETHLTMTGTQVLTVFAVVTLGFPLLVVILGVLVWFRRRA